MHWLNIYDSIIEVIIKTEHNKEIIEEKYIIQNKKYVNIVHNSDLNFIKQNLTMTFQKLHNNNLTFECCFKVI